MRASSARRKSWKINFCCVAHWLAPQKILEPVIRDDSSKQLFRNPATTKSLLRGPPGLHSRVGSGIFNMSSDPKHIRMRSRQFRTAAALFLALCAQTPGLSRAAGEQKFRSDEWITECEAGPSVGMPDCSITVPFWQSRGDQKGSFALVVMLQTGNVGIVGQPFPDRAVLRVDKNPPIECRQARYCVFPSVQAFAVLKQLKVGSLVLIDVFTAKAAFSFSLTAKGYRAGIAQIRAWGYRLE
jgi:hypothetical protein